MRPVTQAEIDALLALQKRLKSAGEILFPMHGHELQMEAVDCCDGRETFTIVVNRKQKKVVKLSKCTYQKQHPRADILLRLDIDGPTHENPDGVEVPCPHLHICREGYGDGWAYPVPLPAGDFRNTSDIVDVLVEFLRYCRFIDTPHSIKRAVL